MRTEEKTPAAMSRLNIMKTLPAVIEPNRNLFHFFASDASKENFGVKRNERKTAAARKAPAMDGNSAIDISAATMPENFPDWPGGRTASSAIDSVKKTRPSSTKRKGLRSRRSATNVSVLAEKIIDFIM